MDTAKFIEAYVNGDHSDLEVNTGVSNMAPPGGVTKELAEHLLACVRRIYADKKQAGATAAQMCVLDEMYSCEKDFPPIPEDALAWFHYCLVRHALGLTE